MLEGKLTRERDSHCEGPPSELLGNWRQKEKRAAGAEMAGEHHRLNGHELGQTPGDGEGQGGLACCSPWACKETQLSD